MLGFLHDQLAIHVDNLTGKEGSSNIRALDSVPKGTFLSVKQPFPWRPHFFCPLYLIVYPILFLQGAEVLQAQAVFVVHHHEPSDRSRGQPPPVSSNLPFDIHAPTRKTREEACRPPNFKDKRQKALKCNKCLSRTFELSSVL